MIKAMIACLLALLWPIVAFAQAAAEALTVEGVANEITSAYQHGGVLALIGAVVALLVRLYKMPWLQDLLPPRAKWKGWPKWAKLLTVGAAAFLLAFLTALGTGMGWVAALTGAVSSALAAVGFDQATKRPKKSPA